MYNEVWLVAAELLAKRNEHFDFDNPEDQDLVISHTYNKLVRYTDTMVRHARSLDQLVDDRPALSERLASDDIQNPLERLITQREENNRLEPSGHESIGAAWMALMRQHNNYVPNAARFLRLSLSHTYHCLNRAVALSEAQIHLPLTAGTSDAFSPRPWRRFKLYRPPEQLTLSFGEERLL